MIKSSIRFTAVLAGAVVVALAIWLVISSRNHSGQPGRLTQAQGPRPPSHATAPSSHSGATILPISQLKRTPQLQHKPVYWVGPRAGLRYEFTATPDGRTYVRYLPKGVTAGSPRPDFLTVGTYVLAHPLADLRRATHAHDAETTHLPGGGLALMDRSRPKSAFIVRPGWKAQVEVYDPTPGKAMAMILSGEVRPVG